MSGERHPTPAERLLALLADESALETLSAGEVRADLAAVGVEPSRCVAFARALAGGTGSPGGKLLGAIDLAEDEEDEIARLESADIEEVRARIPGAGAAAIAAEARRKGGGESNVVAMKRRGRALRWGGPVVGIAASVLLVVVSIRLLDTEFPEILGTTYHFSGGEADGGAAVEYGDDVVAEKTTPESYSMAPQAEVPAEQASRADETMERFARDARPEVQEQNRAARPEAEAVTDRLAKQERREAAPPAAAPAAPAAGLPENPDEEPALADRADDDLPARRSGSDPGDAGVPTEGLAAKPDAKSALGGGAGAAVAAMVIVDPSHVPLALRSQAMPQPDLAARVGEARRLAGDRPVIALYRIAGPAGRQDFAQVPLATTMTQQSPAPMPLTQLFGPAALQYDFLALPPE